MLKFYAADFLYILGYPAYTIKVILQKCLFKIYPVRPDERMERI